MPYRGIEGYDATPLSYKGGFWFFVCLGIWRSTFWDVLGLYRADTLRAAKPVLIDATLSRTAGAFIRRGGRTLRPVQDCARGYGSAVTFCQLDALGEAEFAQTPIGRIWSGPFGCHTYNRQSGLEVIDLFGHIRGLQEVTTSCGSLAPEVPAAGTAGQPISWPLPRPG